MIVLAIAGLIIMIVFLAVPALQRNSRNLERKHAVAEVMDAMQGYYNQHGKYPLTQSGTCAAHLSCKNFVDNLNASNEGILQFYDVKYNDNETDHTFPYTHLHTAPEESYNSVYIFPAHWCNRGSGLKIGDADYPVYSATATDSDFHQFAVYTSLENNIVYCMDTKN